MKGKFKNHIKAGVVIAIALGFIVSGVSVFAQNYNRSQENPLVLTADHYVIVENSSVWPGTTGHNINITGIYSAELFGYIVELYFETANIGIEDVIPTEVNLDGCVFEDPYYFNYTIQHEGIISFITVTSLFTDDWTPGNGVPAGEGKLFNLVVDISEEAEPQIIEINDEILAGPPMLYTLTGGEVEFIDGTLTIIDTDATPPETTCELDGEMEGDDYVGDVTVTLTATDEESGVNYTMIKINEGEYGEYVDPVVVSGLGDHIVYFYSVDNAGNIEDEQTCSFRIVEEISEPDLNIKSIEGGSGIAVTIENNGNGEATDMDVNITIEGGFIILPGEYEYPDTIAAGEEVEITMSVFGIGLGIFTEMPTITVTAECAEGSSAEDSEEAKIFLSKVTIQE